MQMMAGSVLLLGRDWEGAREMPDRGPDVAVEWPLLEAIGVRLGKPKPPHPDPRALYEELENAEWEASPLSPDELAGRPPRSADDAYAREPGTAWLHRVGQVGSHVSS